MRGSFPLSLPPLILQQTLSHRHGCHVCFSEKEVKQYLKVIKRAGGWI